MKSMRLPQPSSNTRTTARDSSTNSTSTRAGNGVYVVVELLDRAVLQLAVQIAKQNGLIGKQFFRILAVALGNALDKLHRRRFDSLVFFHFRSHDANSFMQE